VYRKSLATQYGQGFFGQKTACGQVLRRTTLGVANRTLKCGTPVAVYYRGQMIVVPVIDRGPYANNADWDLTQATAAALGISGTAKIGTAPLPRTSQNTATSGSGQGAPTAGSGGQGAAAPGSGSQGAGPTGSGGQPVAPSARR
jgi:rare lipoprotein A